MFAAVDGLREAARERAVDRLAGTLLAIVASVPMLAAVLLALTLLFASPASAEDLSCGARNLVASLEQTNPAAYEALRQEGLKVRNSDARFWKLEKSGQKPNWLLGTIHLSDPRVTNLPDQSRQAYDAADTVVLESDEILDQRKAALKMMAKPDLMYFASTETLVDYLTPEQQKVLEDNLIKRGIPFHSIVKMKPYMISSMLSLSSCELSRKAHGAPFLDMKLAQDGIAAGKTVKGVETLQEQIEAMASLPTTFHVKALVSAVRYPDYTLDMMETTLQLYLSDRLGMVFPAGLYFAPEKNVDDFKEVVLFEERLITNRNHNMAERAAPILKDGNVFMAVGALHLVGDEGLVELFRKQGYTVTAVK